MIASLEKTEALSKPELRAKDLQELAGVSYALLKLLDRRGVLTTKRKSKTGWRRVSGWEVMTLNIVAHLNREFQIPLVKLSGLMQWLLSGQKTVDLKGYKTTLAGAEEEFQERFFRLAMRHDRGSIEFVNQASVLFEVAPTRKAKQSVIHLIRRICPLLYVVSLVDTNPMAQIFLVTDLEENHLFLTEAELKNNAGNLTGYVVLEVGNSIIETIEGILRA